jgi:hypothetical protein
MTDGYKKVFEDTSSSGQEILIESIEPSTSGRVSHSFTITDIPGIGADVSMLPPFYTKVDAKMPPAPEKVVAHADSWTDNQINYDDDTHIFVTWNPEPDLDSEIMGYYYSLSNNEHTTNGIWTTSPFGEFMGLSEGEIRVYVWARDKAGNIGSSSNGSIIIDLGSLGFENAVPLSENWVNTSIPTCSINIVDYGGAGIDFDSIQYSISKAGSSNYSDWDYVEDLDITNDYFVKCSAVPEFNEGMDNYIKWRARDLSGSDYIESESYLVKVDSKEVAFSLTTPQAKVWQVANRVSCSVTISDGDGSGINASSIEYAFTTNDLDSYCDWRSADLISNAGSVVHTVEVDFQEGAGNYIKWRAKDVAGNGFRVSEDFNIWINTCPQLVISSPSDGSKYEADANIWFDASESSDIDKDELSYYWVSDIEGAIGHISEFKRMLTPGTHKITLFLDDSHAHNISITMTVTTYEIDTDSDGNPDHDDDDDDNDNIPDWWEEQFGLNSKSSTDAGIDTDEDGYSNYEEYQLNSSPLNSSDPPQIGRDGGEDDDKSGAVNEEWLFILVAIIIILIILIIIVFIFIKKSQDRQQGELSASKPEDKKIEDSPRGPSGSSNIFESSGTGSPAEEARPSEPPVQPSQSEEKKSNSKNGQT